MKSICRPFLSIAFLSLCLSLLSTFSFARLSPPPSLVGTWVVTVEGEAETRTLTVASEGVTDTGALLSAKYGITGKGSSQIEAKMARVGERRQLNLVTQAATVITALEQANGKFTGTFTLKNGVVKPLSISRATDADIAASVTSQPKPVMQPPSAKVPANCAAFFGGWGGDVPYRGFLTLWVTSIDEDCSVKYLYGNRRTAPTPNQTLASGAIKNGQLSIARPDGGTTTYDLKDDSLFFRYQGPTGLHEAVFRPLVAALASH